MGLHFFFLSLNNCWLTWFKVFLLCIHRFYCYLEKEGKLDVNLKIIHGNRSGAKLNQVSALTLHKKMTFWPQDKLFMHFTDRTVTKIKYLNSHSSIFPMELFHSRAARFKNRNAFITHSCKGKWGKMWVNLQLDMKIR